MMARDNRFSIDILHTAECDQDCLALLCSRKLLAGFDTLPDFSFVACNSLFAELNETIGCFIDDGLVLAL
jgi:hypothetical protein